MRCSAVSNVSASSQTLHPGKLTGWTGLELAGRPRTARALDLGIVSIHRRPCLSVTSSTVTVWKSVNEKAGAADKVGGTDRLHIVSETSAITMMSYSARTQNLLPWKKTSTFPQDSAPAQRARDALEYFVSASAFILTWLWGTCGNPTVQTFIRSPIYEVWGMLQTSLPYQDQQCRPP